MSGLGAKPRIMPDRVGMSDRGGMPDRGHAATPEGPAAASHSRTRIEAGRVLGWDIGGANIKAATSDGESTAIAFPLWKAPEKLPEELAAVASRCPPCATWAVTMTGEMADCFASRAVGVRALAAAASQAAVALGVSRLLFYRVDGAFVPLDEVIADPIGIASANWHALANWVSRRIESPSLLIDIGGTTTDLIPLTPMAGRGGVGVGHGVATQSRSDFDRLVAGELVYLGGERTPVCALVDALPFGGAEVPVMREVFATIDDCALILGLSPEGERGLPTCDGAPRAVGAATNRLARMIGLDGDDWLGVTGRGEREARDAACDAARAVIAAAAGRLARAIGGQPSRFASRWVISGHTADYFLPGLREAFPDAIIERLSDRVGREGARVGPALACAELGREVVLAIGAE